MADVQSPYGLPYHSLDIHQMECLARERDDPLALALVEYLDQYPALDVLEQALLTLDAELPDQLSRKAQEIVTREDVTRAEKEAAEVRADQLSDALRRVLDQIEADFPDANALSAALREASGEALKLLPADPPQAPQGETSRGP